MAAKTLYKVTRYRVICEDIPISPYGINCNGPKPFGFDFYIDVDDTEEAVKSFLIASLKTYGLPYVRIETLPGCESAKLLDRVDIADFIRKGYKNAGIT